MKSRSLEIDLKLYWKREGSVLKWLRALILTSIFVKCVRDEREKG